MLCTLGLNACLSLLSAKITNVHMPGFPHAFRQSNPLTSGACLALDDPSEVGLAAFQALSSHPWLAATTKDSKTLDNESRQLWLRISGPLCTTSDHLGQISRQLLHSCFLSGELGSDMEFVS